MTYLDCIDIVMVDADGKIRRIYVNGPPGFMADTNPIRSRGYKTLVSMLRRACSWQFCQSSAKALSIPGACMTDVRVTLMDDPIEDSLIINWMLSFAHDGIIGKFYHRRNVLKFKNPIIGQDVNLNAEGRNGYRLTVFEGGQLFGASNRNGELIRLGKDRELTEEEDEDLQYFAPPRTEEEEDNESVTCVDDWDWDEPIDPAKEAQLDRLFMMGMVSCVTYSSPGDEESHEEALEMTLHYLEHGRNGVKLKPKAISRRYKTFCDSGWVTGRTLAEFKALYESTRKNKGNRTGNHHNARFLGIQYVAFQFQSTLQNCMIQ